MDNKNVVINATNFHQSVYAYRCEKSTIRVNGKVNFIALGTSIQYHTMLLLSINDHFYCRQLQEGSTGL